MTNDAYAINAVVHAAYQDFTLSWLIWIPPSILHVTPPTTTLTLIPHLNRNLCNFAFVESINEKKPLYQVLVVLDNIKLGTWETDKGRITVETLPDLWHECLHLGLSVTIWGLDCASHSQRTSAFLQVAVLPYTDKRINDIRVISDLLTPTLIDLQKYTQPRLPKFSHHPTHHPSSC